MSGPVQIAPTADAIPEPLRERPVWVCWRVEQRDGEPTKLPVNPTTGDLASATDPASWSDYETAWEYHTDDATSTAGVGYVFSSGGPFVGVDLDEPEPVIDLADVIGDAPEPVSGAELWDEFGDVVYCYVLEVARQETNEALGDLARAVRDERRPTAEEIDAPRGAIDRVREFVEDHYAAPGDRGGAVGGRLPH